MLDAAALADYHIDLTAKTVTPEAEFSAVQANLSKVKYALEHNGEFFIDFFLHKELTYKVPQFHIKCWLLMTTSSYAQVAITLPRGHAKTTLAKLSVVWYFLFTKKRFCVYLSNTQPVALDACRDIIHYMEESDNFRALYGEIKFESKNEGRGLYIFILNGKRCVLRALGAGQQVRGLNVDNQRPDLAIIDDLEDIENTRTPHLLKQLQQWVYRTFFKALSRNYKIIWIGNIISNNCILKQLVESKAWQSMRLGAILSDGRPLWPDMWTLKQLQEDFLEYKRAGMVTAWYAEMMNMPMPEGNGLITAEQIIYKPRRHPVDFTTGFVTIDPAISKKTIRDKTAIVVHGIVEQKPEVIDYVHEQLDPLETITETLRLTTEYGINVIGIESNAYQASLKFWFDTEFQRNGIINMEVVELYSMNKKVERLLVWASMMKAGYYGIPQGDIEITEQLLEFDPASENNHDDLIDGCAQAVPMLENFMHLILQNHVQYVVNKVQRELEICGV